MSSTSKAAALAEALKQTQPFVSRSQEAYLCILRTASELSRSTDQLLKTFGITQPQYNVLRILRGAQPDGLCRNDISERMVTVTPDMSRLLERMEKSGWIVRRRGQLDRREVSTGITADGKKLLLRIERPLTALHLRQFKDLPPANLFLFWMR